MYNWIRNLRLIFFARVIVFKRNFLSLVSKSVIFVRTTLVRNCSPTKPAVPMLYKNFVPYSI